MYIRFGLKAELQFSAEIPDDARPAVERLVLEANTVLFRKGVPKDAEERETGRITGWKTEGNRLLLDFESGTYTRVHDALFRFRKQIAPTLGKFRLGLRGIEVLDYSVEMTGEFPEGFRIPQLPFIRESALEGDTLRMKLDLSAADLENKVPDRIVRLVEEKIQAAGYGGKTEHWDLVFESGKKPRTFGGDPTEEMIRRGWVRHALSRGQWIHGSQSTQLFRAFEKIVMQEIIEPLGFTEMIFPKLVPWEVWKKSGHAKGVYPEIYYVCTPKTRDPAYWEDIGDYFKVTGEVWVEEINKRIDGPIGGLCYAQCPRSGPTYRERPWPTTASRHVSSTGAALPTATRAEESTGSNGWTNSTGSRSSGWGPRNRPWRSRTGCTRPMSTIRGHPGTGVALRPGHPLVHGPGRDDRDG